MHDDKGTDALLKDAPMTDLDRVRVYMQDKLQEADKRQEERVQKVYDRIGEIAVALNEATTAINNQTAALDKHQALEDGWRKHHEDIHSSAVIPRINSLEESRKFVANKVAGYVISGVLAASVLGAGAVWLIK